MFHSHCTNHLFTMKITVFWDVMARSLEDITNILEKPAAAIFRVEWSRFFQNVSKDLPVCEASYHRRQ